MRHRKLAVPRRRSRLSKADLRPLEVLDRILAWERDMQQRYNLPFRPPQQIQSGVQGCMRCHGKVAFLIFGDLASDVAGLEGYARLMDKPIREINLPTYVLGLPEGAGPLDERLSLLLKVWPEQEEPRMITPPEWEHLIEKLSLSHCQAQR